MINGVICNLENPTDKKIDIQLFLIKDGQLVEESFPLQEFDDYDDLKATDLQFVNVEILGEEENFVFKITNHERATINVMGSHSSVSAYDTITSGDFEDIVLNFSRSFEILGNQNISLN